MFLTVQDSEPVRVDPALYPMLSKHRWELCMGYVVRHEGRHRIFLNDEIFRLTRH